MSPTNTRRVFFIGSIAAAAGAGYNLAIPSGYSFAAFVLLVVITALLAAAYERSIDNAVLAAQRPRREAPTPSARPRPEDLPQQMRSIHAEVEQLVSSAESIAIRLRSAAHSMTTGAIDIHDHYVEANKERTELRGVVKKIGMMGDMINRELAIAPAPAEEPRQRQIPVDLGAIEQEVDQPPIGNRARGFAEDLDARLAKPQAST